MLCEAVCELGQLTVRNKRDYSCNVVCVITDMLWHGSRQKIIKLLSGAGHNMCVIVTSLLFSWKFTYDVAGLPGKVSKPCVKKIWHALGWREPGHYSGSTGGGVERRSVECTSHWPSWSPAFFHPVLISAHIFFARFKDLPWGWWEDPLGHLDIIRVFFYFHQRMHYIFA